MDILDWRPMARSLSIVLILLGITAGSSAAADLSWTGTWDTHWRDGGAPLVLHQDGDHVSGEYALYGGKVDGIVNGTLLRGHWTEGARTGDFLFSMANDGQSFTGRYGNGEWWTGGRTLVARPSLPVDQTGVREALRTFVEGGNLADAGVPEALGASAAVLDYRAYGSNPPPGQKLAIAKSLHDLIDLTTFQLWSLPGRRAEGPTFSATLRQAGTDATLPLDFRQEDGRWFIVAPSAEAIDASRKALLVRYGGRLPEPSAFLKQRSARDTMTAFLSAFADWNGGGRERVLGTLDTSKLFAATRDYEGLLSAQYLKLTLDRIKEIIPQEIPDDPADRQPYLVFEHPAGKLVIAPIGEGDKTVWKFTTGSVRDARNIYQAVETMPVAGTPVLVLPPSDFFAARNWVQQHAPGLLERLGPVEYWQVLGAVLGVLSCLVVAGVVGAVAGRVIRWDVGGRPLAAERALRWPLRLALAALLFKLLIPVLGWPEEVRQYSAPIHAVIIALFGVWAGWFLIDALSFRIVERAKRTPGASDDITVSLGLGAIRLALVFVAVTYVATELSLPTEGLLAGLGLSGLAFAFASKETLSNVFGAGILVADHPFKRGDWITTGDIQGTVEKVGIRSTRIRTAEDSVAVVPNGKLSDASINNWGSRRHRLVKGKFLVSYNASSKVEAFVDGLRRLLDDTDEVVTERSQVGLAGLAEEGIEIEFTAYLAVSNAADEKAAKTRLFLMVLHLAAQHGVALGNMVPPAELAADPRSTAAA